MKRGRRGLRPTRVGNALVGRVASDADLRSIIDPYGSRGGGSRRDPVADLERPHGLLRRRPLMTKSEGPYAGLCCWYEGHRPW